MIRAALLAVLALALLRRQAAGAEIPDDDEGEPAPEPAAPRWSTPAAGLPFLPFFQDAELQLGLPAGLLSRVAWEESRYSPSAVSPAGAVGLMQIVPKWHPGVDPLDPVASIYYAGSYLQQLYRQFRSWTLALAAYNAGPGTVQQYGGVPPYAETQRYVTAITRDLGLT